MTEHAGEDAPAAGEGSGTAGDARVDEALRSVEGLDDLPVDEHADRLAAAHTALQEVLRSPSGP